MKNLFFVLSLVLLLGGCSGADQQQNNSQSTTKESQQARVITLNSKDFQSKFQTGKGILLDVRTPAEINQGILSKDATVIDIYSSDFAKRVLELPKDEEIYIYCSAGVRSEQAANFLIENGYTQVFHLRGGLGDWARNGLPLERL
ncbi:Rhodanese-related sulfurtransferase [Algoriphagus faecimaris]|uniref:Rhodanese-related sulfurtransferase n=1 Tax=Algoriphagus faecimaris TaxID=686796 RepID=A0A1G6QF01_9BACT|nr:rhodanese-like domain-containing protein [Algoriphagus faecimaris]SDC91050.1 Rhodanese-related sulfurtransferase [Algoriphagus faecimaris]